ncbi:C_GCAxxG_C_C family protein [Mobilitalea sibirica]|uniref:C_GCAxxG_C_C family protein n=1 Tax=Mobilitalea sibirica TaxID=1462919 RepID=A0A8J7KWL0_9FIRM|nr:C-GCAxxG-C-C family protein [Mobilitalea sibirica]MBH1940602.1 C_GCAxxG_C_C family protein [Mobilitalea sibirica]
MNKAKEAVQCFHEGYNCSQAVFSSYSEELGLERDTALKIACPFGGGMGRMGKTCGAVTGAFMLIGLKHGTYQSDQSKETTYRLVQEFTEKFKEMYGSIECKDLLNCDISTEGGRAFASEHGLFDKLCPIYVEDAVKLIEELMELKQ